MTTPGSSNERWLRIWELFEAALELPRAEQDELVRQRADDPEMRAEVEGLLRGHHSTGGLVDRRLEVPPPNPDPSPDSGADDAAMDARVRAVFSDSYGLVRELGRGGMSRVYLAWERKHQRRVVLKILHPEVAAGQGAARFERETSLIARLSHPNIVPLIDSGVRDEFAYYVMPYIDAVTLRTRMSESAPGRLPLPRILALLRDVAAALDFAHVAGVVHRDLKPDNVLLAGAHTYLFDFGIAWSSPPGVDTSARLTHDGAFLGTPGYAAPEQIWGGSALDRRADLWAWGVMAWELITGRLPSMPFEMDGVVESDTTEALVAAAPELPIEVAEVIVRCLSVDPGGRPDDAATLLDVLGAGELDDEVLPGAAPPAAPATGPSPGRWRLLVTAAAVGAVGLFWWRGEAGRLTDETLRLPIAVGPLVSEAPDSEVAVLGRFAGDWLTQGIQELDGVQVVPWPASLAAAGDVGPGGDVVQAVAAGTGAATVVSGSIYEVDGRLQFRAELVDVATGRIVSAPPPVSASRDSAEAALQLLVGRIRSSVAISRDPRLAAIPGLARRPPAFEAYRAFDRGVERYIAQDYRGASTAFLRAWDLDSTFHSARVYAALTLSNAGEPEAADSLLQAVEPHLGELTTPEAVRWEAVRAVLDGDAPRAYQHMRRLAELGPGSRASYNVALLALTMNRPADAHAALAAADPDRGELRGWAQYWTQLAHAHHLLGDFEAEAAAAAEMRRRHPERRIALVLEVRARAAQGDEAEVARLLDLAETMSPATYWSAGAGAVVAAEALRAHGHPGWESLLERAEAWITEQRAAAPDDLRHAYWHASAAFDDRRWSEARSRFDTLRAAAPDNTTYRGMFALSAAHAGDLAAAEDALRAPFEWDAGEHTAYRARLASLAGDADAAAGLLGLAFDQGVGGWPWIHEAGFDDFAPVADDPRIELLLAPRR